MPTAPASAQPTLDPSLTLALAAASRAAYLAYQQQPYDCPAGYSYLDAWTGWDAFLCEGREEAFGLVFRSDSDPGTLILAFRGTDSDMDVYEDVHILTRDFQPFSRSLSPPPQVASGFYGIYADRGEMAQSMREQLFALLEKYAPSHLHVTGHSLGAALSQLFSLDLALSRPMSATNLNFSSPMVGTASWQAIYAQAIAADASTRVYNYWDYVPSVPPAELGYGPVGSGFRTAFYVLGEWFPHELSRHSLVNLTTVLSNALTRTPQQWAGKFADFVEPDWTMLSTLPPGGGTVDWAGKIGEQMQFERSLRDQA